MTRKTNRRAWEQSLFPQGQHGAAPVQKTRTASLSDLEFKIQSGFISWVRIVEVHQLPVLRLLYAIPNGGLRHPAVAVKMKREGVRRGVPDLCLPVARGGFHSLRLETKAPGGVLSEDQKTYATLLREEGNRVEVCYSIEELQTAVLTYLGRIEMLRKLIA